MAVKGDTACLSERIGEVCSLVIDREGEIGIGEVLIT